MAVSWWSLLFNSQEVINQFFDWLDDDENLEKWYGANSYITTDEKRILITNWAGNSYRRSTKSSYDVFRWRLFEKTGCLINADGSEDKINPKDLPDYKVPPPILLDPSTAPVELSSVPGHDSEVEEDVFDDFDGDDEMDDKEIVRDDELS